MKLISFLSLFLFISVVTFSCKESTSTEGEATTENAQDSVFLANRDAVFSIMGGYDQEVDNKIRELQDVAASAEGSVDAELAAYQDLKARLEETRLKMSASNSTNWVVDSTAWEDLRYEVKMAISTGTFNMKSDAEQTN